MKIVYDVPGCSVSGGLTVICQHANRLTQRGHQVYLLSENYGDRRTDWFPNQKVPVITHKDYPKDVDILVATQWGTPFEVAPLSARAVFYFVQSDESRFFPDGTVEQQIALLSYLFDANYLTEARWIQSWLKDAFDHDAELVPNGLDEKIFYPSEPLEPRNGRPRILLEGAINVASKGMKEAFEALAGLDAEVWCVSYSGQPKPEWKCDRFFKQVPITEMRRIYSSCDILLKLSRVEGFFGPPMEMMACGGAVVVGKVTGHDEYIVDGHNALVVDAQDIRAARAAVERIISDPELKNKLVANGAITAKQWAWEPSIDRLEAYYLDVLAGKRGQLSSPASRKTNEALARLCKSGMFWVTEPRSEPIDMIYSRLRRQGWARRLAEVAYLNYRWLKKLKNKIQGRQVVERDWSNTFAPPS